MAKIGRSLVVSLVLVLAWSIVASGADAPPITSRVYGSVTSGSQALPDGTAISAWVGGTKLAEGATFAADGGSAFILDVPGDIAATPEIEGAQAGQTLTFKVGGATAPETAGWQTGSYGRQDLTVSAGADIAVTIDDGETAVYPTSILVYTLTVENRSSAAASGVVLEGTVPEHVTLLGADGATVSGRLLTWPAVELPGGATVTRSVSVQVGTTFPQGTDSIVASAHAFHDGSQGIDPDAANDRAADTDALQVPPDFAIAASDLVLSPAQPVAGQSASVTLTVHNPGFVAGTALVVLYDGPIGTGALIGSQVIDVAAGGTATVSTSFVASASTVVVSAVVDPENQVVEVDERNNTAQKFLAEVPDLAVGVDNISLTPESPRAGDAVSVAVTVRNGGRVPASSVPLAVYDGEPENGGTLVFSATSGALANGGNRTITLTWTATEGPHQLTVVVDEANQVLEISEDNNRATRTVNVARASGPDLVVAGVDLAAFSQSPVTLVAGGTVRATVRNVGDGAVSAPMSVRIFEDRDGSGGFGAGDRELGRQALAGGLGVGASAVATLAVQSGLQFFHSPLLIEVDPEGQIAELREDNNLGSCFGACESSQSAALLPIVEKWKVPGVEVETAPLVVQLSDDNGDGRIDGGDVADVVFHMEDAAGAAVTARSGLDGSELWTVRSVLGNGVAGRLAHAAAADLDGDGVVEILVGLAGKLGAIDHNGGALWVSDPVERVTTGGWGGSVSVADLDEDGVPEIIVGRTALSNTGRLLAVGAKNKAEPYNYYAALGYPYPTGVIPQHSIVADIDLDGQAEIVAGDAVYRLRNGELQVVWDYTVPDNLMVDGFSAVANLDADPQAEIVYVASGKVMVFNHDGSVQTNYRRLIPLSQFTPTTYWGGPPTIADLNGDGVPEILVAGDTELVAMNAGLGTLWRFAIDDLGSVTGVTLFDLDGDTFPEVVFGDHSKLWILDGRTGTPRYTQANSSKTGTEYPVVADLDHDGNVELLVASNRTFGGDTSTQGLHVLTGPGWVGSRPIWNQYAYHVTNVQLDGTVPSPEPPSWQAQNTYRANLPKPREPQRLPNATLGLPRVGATTPTGIPVTLRVGSGGRASLPKGLRIRLFGGSDPQTAPVVGEATTSKALVPGEWEDEVVVWRQAGPAGVPGSAMVDPTSALTECDEADNSVAFTVEESVLPDLVIAAGGVTAPASPVAGQKLPIQVTVSNVGPAVAAASILRLFDGPPILGRIAGEVALPALNPAETRVVFVDWDGAAATGRRLIFAIADADETVVERVETNNQGFTSVTLAEPTKPDLSIESLEIAPVAVSAGTPVTLTAEVMNRGLVLTGGTAVAFKLNNAEVARVPIAETLERGARRTVSATVQTLSLTGHILSEAKADPANAIVEVNETNNSATGYFDVQASGLVANITTDRVAYGSNQSVALAVTAQNSGAGPRTMVLRVTIQDGSGQLVATVRDETATLPPGSTTFNLSWPTGATPAGPYAALAELVDNGTVIARASAPFSIQADRTASAQIFADRDRYEPTQSAALTGRVRNTGVNAALSNLQAKIVVSGPAGTVFTHVQSIALLSPGAEGSVDTVWPVNNAAPGLYTARLEVRDLGGAGVLLAFGSTDVTVLDSSQTGAGLSAELTVSPELLGSGGLLLASFSTRNGGNADMTALRLRVRLERLADGQTAAVEEFAWPLARNQQRSGSLGLATAGFQEGEYVAVLEGLVPGGDLALGRATFAIVRGVSVGDATVTEGNSGTTQALFEVVLSSAAPDTVEVDYATADGTAVAGEDYDTVTGTLTFQAGETRKTVAVNVHGDLAPESNEVFLLTLSGRLGAALGDGQALGTIVDEEGCPSPSLLTNGGAEDGAGDSELPGWTPTSGTWKRRFADPRPIDGRASLGAADSVASAELRQDVDLSPYAARIDAGNQELLFEGFAQSAPDAQPDGARVVVEYRNAANTAVLDSFDSGEITSAVVWKAVVHAQPAPAGTRWARVRLHGVDHGAAGLGVFFDRLNLRSLGVTTLTANGTTVNEGNSGTVPAQFSLQLSCPAPGSLEVDYATANGTAVAGSDYDTASGTVTFAPGETAKTIDVAVRGDSVDEPDEEFFLDLSGTGSSVVLLDRRAAASVTDDDGSVSIAVSDAYVDEGNAGPAPAEFTVTLAAPSGKTVTVSYATVAATATSGSDFTPRSGTLTFAPGVESLTVAVTVNGDRLDELDETFGLHLSGPVNAGISDADGTGTILDDDQTELSVGDVSVLEGNGAGVSLVFPVTLSLAADREVGVHYASIDGTAVAGIDYQAVSGTLALPAGTTTASVSVPVLGNTTEQPDRAFLLRLDTPQVATLADPEAVGTIRDDDGSLISIKAPTSDDVVVTEGDAGSTNVTLTVSVTNNATKTVSVNYATADGTATGVADYTAVSGTLSFPPGTSNRTVTVAIVGDLTEEVLTEAFQVVLSNPVNGTIQRAAATVTVADNDGWVLNGPDARLDTVPGCLFLVRSFFSRAGVWKKQPISLAQSFDQTYSVYLGANDGGADGITFTLQSRGLDALGDGAHLIGIGNLSPAVSVELDTHPNPWDPVVDHMAVDLNGNLLHSGTPLGTLPVPATPTSANIEDGKLHDLRVIWNATAKVLDVHFDGNERLMYGADVVSQIFSGNPTVFFGLTAGSGGLTNDHYACPTVQCADPTRPTQVSVGDVRIVEGHSGTTAMVFPVTLSCASAQPMTVAFEATGGTAVAGSDFTSTSGTLTFQPGETSKDVVVPILGDTEAEPDETLFLDLADPVGGTIRYGRGVGSIVNDETGLLVDDVTTVEPTVAGGKLMVRVRRAGPGSSAATVRYDTADGTARAGQDYTAVGGTLTFQPGEVSKQVFITLLGDGALEPDEQFFLRLSNPTNAEISDGEGVVRLLDDDDCPSPNLMVNGGGDQPLVNGDIPGWTEVVGTAWTNAVGCNPAFSGACIFGGIAANAELRQDIDLSGFASRIDQGIQSFRFEGFGITQAGMTAGESARIVVEYLNQAQGTVLASFDSGEFDTPLVWRHLAAITQAPAGTRLARVRLIARRTNLNSAFDGFSLAAMGVPSVSVSNISAVEGTSGVANASIPVQLSCSSTFPVSVDYLTQDGTAQAGTDYQATLGTLTFAPAESSKSVAVPILGDTRSEGNETFFLNLASPVNAGIADPQGQVTILDDEVSLAIAGASVIEGNSGVSNLVFRVTLSGPSQVPVSVDYATVDDTARAGSDYNATSGTLVFQPGETTKDIVVEVLGDTTVEPDEKLVVTLDVPVNAVLFTGRGTGTIVQDDISISIGDAAVIEGNTGTVDAVFPVTLVGASTVQVSVTWQVEGGDATPGSDFVAPNPATQTLVFLPGETKKTLTIQVNGDVQLEPGEIFFVRLSNPVNAVLGDDEGQGSIADDDDCPSPNLLANASGEEPLFNGEIPSWTEVVGSSWETRGVALPLIDGVNAFFAGPVTNAELRQDVDLSAFVTFIDAGIQRFLFQGYVRSAFETSSDPARIVIELLDANKAILAAEDSGEIVSTSSWRSVSMLRPAPEGTRFARVRLIGRRVSPGNLDAYFDALSLRSLGTPTLAVSDLNLMEGDTEEVPAPFAVTLGCASTKPITVHYATADMTATAPSDYTAVSGDLSFAPGETAKTVTVQVAGDFRNEIQEKLALRLTAPVNAAALDPQGVAAINDRDPGLPPVPGTDVTYTFDDDFDKGALFGLDHQAPNNDQLQVSLQGGAFPYLWVAASARGTIVKIHSASGVILGEYSTNPDAGAFPDPSRTTVAPDGSVWVGNRNASSVAHVGLPEIGQCVDRNGNGVIETSTGYNDVLPWPGTTDLAGTGVVTQAKDECIIHFTKTSASAVRHVSANADNSIWVTGWAGANDRVFNLISPNGQILRTEGPVPCGGYGGLTDRNGVIWSASRDGAVLRWDPSVVPSTAQSLRCVGGVRAYGLAIDSKGDVWVSDAFNPRVWKISSDGNTVFGPYARGSQNAQGLAVDGNDEVWVSSCACGPFSPTVGHLKNDGRFIGDVVGVPIGSTGVAVADDGKIWTANLTSSTASRIDPAAGPIGSDGVTPIGQVDLIVPLPGANPYNYSDMTGFLALHNTAGSGNWQVIQDAGQPGAAWGMVRWNGEPQGSLPAGTTITAEVRAADTVAGLGGRAYVAISSGVPFVQQGRYLQVRFTLKRNTAGVSPVLSDLRIQTAQTGELSASDVTVTEGTGGTTAATFEVSLAQQVNRNVTVSYATVDGTARAGEDYTATSGTLTIAYGETRATVTVPVAADSVSEPDEGFRLDLSAPVGATLVKPQGLGRILNDDGAPELSARKTDTLAVDGDGDGDAAAGPNDVLEYRIVLENVGTAAASNVLLSDSAPAHTTMVAGSVTTSSGTIQSESPVQVLVPEVAAGASVTVTFRVRIDSDVPEAIAEVSNQGQATAAGLAAVPTDDPDTGAAGDPTVTPIVHRPRLQASKTATLAEDRDSDGVPSPGDVLAYAVEVRNVAGGAANDVVLRDPAPAQTTLVAGSITTDRGTVSGTDPVEVTIGRLLAGETATVRFRAAIDPSVPLGTTQVSNQGTVLSRELAALLTDDPGVGGDADPTVTSITARARLVAEKVDTLAVDADNDGVASPGDTLAYAITIRNLGNTTATAVTFRDTAPPNTTIVAGSAQTSKGTIGSEDPLLVDLGQLEAGEEAVIRLQVRLVSPWPTGVLQVENQGTVRSDGLDLLTDDPDAGGAADPTVTLVTARPMLRVEKTAVLFDDADGDHVASPGDQLLYRIDVDNVGNGSATAVALHDPIPTATALVDGSVQVDRGTITSVSPITVEVGTLLAGERVAVSFRVRIEDPFPSDRLSVSNQATVESAELPVVNSDDPATAEAGDPTRTDVFISPVASVEDLTVAEAETTAPAVVRLDRPSNRPISIGWATSDGTATAGTDYQSSTATAVVPPGELVATLPVPLLPDALDEPDETFTVTLQPGQGYRLGDGEGVVTVSDDDAAPQLVLASASVNEGDSGETLASFAVSLSAPSGFPVRVSLRTQDGSAGSSDYRPTEGLVEIPPGQTAAAFGVPVVGDVLDELDETFLVQVVNVEHAVPAVAGATGTILDDDAPPQLTIDDATVGEGSGSNPTAVVTVHLSAPSGQQVRVDFATADDTALAPADYQPASGTLVLDPGQTEKPISMTVAGDLLDEPDETFRVALSSPVAASIGDGSATVTILDDDAPPRISVGDLVVTEGSAGTTTGALTVRLSAPSGREVRVAYATQDGTAQQPGDYEASTGTLTFAPGQTEQSVMVRVVGDTTDEPDESFTVVLSSAADAEIEDSTAIVTIVDDDEAPVPSITVDDVSVLEGDSGTVEAVFRLHLSSPASLEASVAYATASGTATSGVDFEAAAGRVTFPAGQSAANVLVRVKGDTLLEGDESFDLNLSQPVAATLAEAVGRGTIRDDEVCLGSNLVRNPGAEERPAGGEIPAWTEVEGTQWGPKSPPPMPYEGLSSFSSGSPQYAQLRQDVDISAFATRIDAGLQRFSFTARVRSLPESTPDLGRVVVEYRDAPNQVALQVFDSGDLASVAEWREVSDARTAPAGARWVRVRLLTTRLTTGSNDSFFDAVSLRSMGTAAVSVNDVKVYEGNSGLRDAVFTVSLSCPYARTVEMGYATADGTALSPSDYQARSGSLTFAPGSTAAQVAVPVVGDRLDEPHETFFLNLTLASGSEAILADRQGKGTIWNDDFCQHSPGYWKNHQSVWPVTELQLGGVWYYKTQLVSFLSSGGPDASILLSHHLVATKLNLERGSDPTWGASPSVLPTVDQADVFLAAHPPGSNPGGADRTLALQLKDVLDAYNNAGCRP